MKSESKYFAELRPGEAFSCSKAVSRDKIIPERPNIFIKVGNTCQAVFLPTGWLTQFDMIDVVSPIEIKIEKVADI